MKALSSLTLTTLVSAVAIGHLPAIGFGFEYQSARASARGNVSTAGFSDATMLHYNPAALALGEKPTIAVNSFFNQGDISVSQGGTEYETDGDWNAVGSLYFAHPLEIAGRKVAFGAGVRVPYGQKVSWQGQVPFSAFGESAEMIHIEYLVGGALELGRGVSIGGNVFFADSELTTDSSGLFLPSDEQRFTGNDNAWGFQLAFHHQVNPSFSWGINYRSGLDLDYSGEIDYQSGNPLVPNNFLSANSPLAFPDHLTIGFEWQATEQLSLGMQAQWSGWSSVDEFKVENELQTVTQPVDWQDNWNLSAGGSYAATSWLDLHFGYMFTESLIDEPYHTPLNGDFDQHFYSVGASVMVSDWQFDVAVVRLAESERSSDASLYGFTGDHQSDGWFVNLGALRSF
ncbi:MAG: outer membrane protein transport protein [Verrucomicrobiota bacterium JB023]|nr:outer membrane protein transport protein [Verrucomicrobiota bacterium JB023]